MVNLCFIILSFSVINYYKTTMFYSTTQIIIFLHRDNFILIYPELK